MTRRAAAIWLCLAAILGSAVVPMLYSGTAAFDSLATFPIHVAASIVAVIMMSWLAKGAKFRLLTRRVGHAVGLVDCSIIALACDFAFVATPGGLGGYAASVYLFDRIGVTTGAATAVTAADQLLDLLFFAVTVPLAALWLLEHSLSPGLDVQRLIAALLGLIVLVVVVRAIGPGRWRRLGERVMHFPVLRRRREGLRNLWHDTLTHWRDLRTAPAGYVFIVLLITAAQWLTRYAVLGLALAGFGHRVPAAVVLLLQSVALHAGQWTGVPGGVGGADLIIAQSLQPWVPLAVVGGALLAWRIATFYLTLLAGGLTFAWLTLLPHDRDPLRTGRSRTDTRNPESAMSRPSS